VKRNPLRIGTLAILVACTGSGDAAGGGKLSKAAAPVAAVRPRFTIEQFHALRWLEGNWRGTMPNGVYFYESYRVVNDTIQMYVHADSTFGAPTDSSRIYFHDGAIYDGPNQVVDLIDENGVRFIPLGPRKYFFVWKSTGPDSWTATISGTNEQVVYQMVRMPVRAR
jgi:hypothetical protein